MREFPSQFDPKVIITNDNIAVTLIRSPHNEFVVFRPEHAILAIEEVINDEYVVHLADLVNPYTHFENIDAVVNNHWGHKNDPTKVRYFTPHKTVEHSGKSHTWPISRDKADLMLKEIQEEAAGKNVPAFYMLGGKSILTYASNHERHGKPVLNCIGWALAMLRLAGINLSQGSFNLATKTDFYIKKDNKYHLEPYGIHELCDFIKLGRIEAIRRFYPPHAPNVDLNKLTKADVGSVEFQLVCYTPLMIACGYGRWDIAKMLINEYGVDVNVRSSKGFPLALFDKWLSYNALECAERNLFGITTITKDDGAAKAEVINLIKEKMQQSKQLHQSRLC